MNFKTMFSALPAHAGIHGVTNQTLQSGHGPQRSLGTRIGRVSLLALVCALGVGAAAGQETPPVESPIEDIENDPRTATIIAGGAPIQREILDTPIAILEIVNCGVLDNELVLSETCEAARLLSCLLYTSPSPRDQRGSRMPSSA